MPEGGDVAILSASATATNQNAWIAAAEEVLPNYPGINLVATVYGDDLSDKSYREAQGLMASYPDLRRSSRRRRSASSRRARRCRTPARSARSTSPVLACPPRWRAASNPARRKSFAIWNPIDLGYSATMIAHALARAQRGRAGRGNPDGPHGLGDAGRHDDGRDGGPVHL
jgi:rhamnose transport system substrate-binding protein